LPLPIFGQAQIGFTNFWAGTDWLYQFLGWHRLALPIFGRNQTILSSE
jgi:hypothetical protein